MCIQGIRLCAFLQCESCVEFLEAIAKTRDVKYNKLHERDNLSIIKRARWSLMLKNNIEIDVKVKCIEAETTQAKLAEDVGTTLAYVNRLIKKSDGIINKTFIAMLEKLGYDIELTYVKREEK